MVASTIEKHFEDNLATARDTGAECLATMPPLHIIEAVIDAAFWASLQKEEGHPPKISIALLHPSQARLHLKFGTPLRLTPHNLKKLAPAVERPGVHLAVWNKNDEAFIWGTSHILPGICFVLEVVEPGLMIIKHSRADGFGKFVNVAILNGDQVKFVAPQTGEMAEYPAMLSSLLGKTLPSYLSNKVNVLIELAAVMRAHGRGGIVAIVPSHSDNWRKSVVHPITYPVEPAYDAINKLMVKYELQENVTHWQDKLLQAIEIVGGFTAVDGATIINQDNELLAFGAKLTRSDDSQRIERMNVTEPVIGAEPKVLHPAQNGGTRHLAAAQFVHDQRDAIALVASQDGNFTIFAWSAKLNMVHANRIDVLLM
ncbi:putative sensor domain DACNV-containing protein [Mucilaginibacter ginkgonis]|nr:hypothetical protein [Mucilaginibacter ginkgonis]